jgi:hypothetical protein
LRAAWAGSASLGLGLGLAELLAPERLARLSGLDGRSRVLKAFGAREIAPGIPLVTASNPVPWLWGRVAGDILDGGLLASTFLAPDRSRRRRALTTFLAIAPVVALDAFFAVRHSGARG